MNTAVKAMYDRKLLRDIDAQFGEKMAEVFSAPNAETFLALLFSAVSSSDTYMDSPDTLPFYEEFKREIDEAFSEENQTAMVRQGIITDAPDTGAPIIRSVGRLYLKSFYLDEKAVREYILSAAEKRYEYPEERLKELLDRYFGMEGDMQKAAALLACLDKFCVISGGPGTGKTHTVFNVLAILCELAETDVMIAAAAPTGKAASRLTESIAIKTAGRNDPFIKSIPQKAVTLHRLLNIHPSTGRAQYNERNPMPYDIVVVDEASMVDIGMMANIARAMKPDGRLILLGDKDQLASVQPGNVLGDICAASGTESFTHRTAEIIKTCAEIDVPSTGKNDMSDVTIQLTKSRRFESGSGIGLLAAACRRGDADEAMELILNDKSGQIEYIEFDDAKDALEKYFIKRFEQLSKCADTREAVEAVNKSRLLTPHAKGALGTERLNSEALKLLSSKGYIDGTKKYFHGLPVMVTENDYNIGLFNGDTGIIFNDGSMRACFDTETGVRAVSVLRMPSWSPVFAMTVHKSQGSEFDHVVFVLPDADSPIMTRELFYTAVTRAKSKLTIIAQKSKIIDYFSRTIQRKSGLFI